MASITLESTAVAGRSSSGTLTVTKPTGLAVGDLLVFAGQSMLQGASVNIATASGWTSAISTGGTSYFASVQHKVADSSDVAASNFSWTFTTGSGQSAWGCLFRLSNVYDDPNQLEDTGSASTTAAATDTSISLSPTVDFTVENCFIVGLVGTADVTGGNPAAISSYSTTPSITWTELYDIDEDGETGGNDVAGSVIYGTHSSTTSISAFSATLEYGFDDHYITFAAYRPDYPDSGTVALHSPAVNFTEPAGQADTNGTVALESVDTTLPTQSGAVTKPTTWTNQSKPSASSFTNPDKP